MSDIRFWLGMTPRGAAKRNDKLLIGNIDTGESAFIDVSELLAALTTDDLPEGLNRKYITAEQRTKLDNLAAGLLTLQGAAQYFYPLSSNPAGYLNALSEIPAANIAGILADGNIPQLSAAKIVSGVLNAARIPSLDASKITTGTLHLDRLPMIPASKVESMAITLSDYLLKAAVGAANGAAPLGADARISVGYLPNFDASKITTGVFAEERIPSTFLKQVDLSNYLLRSETEIFTPEEKIKLSGLSEFNGGYGNREAKTINVGNIGSVELWEYLNANYEPTIDAWNMAAGIIYFFTYTQNELPRTSLYEGDQPVKLGINEHFVGANDFSIISKSLGSFDTFLNVKEFGAIAGEDSTGAINAAIAEAKKGVIKDVYVSEDYIISGTIYVPSNVRIFGTGGLILAPNSSHLLDVIIPIDYEGLTDVFKWKTMIATETAHFTNEGSVTENVRIEGIKIDWNDNPCGVNSALPVMFGRSFHSHLINCRIPDVLPSDLEGVGKLHGKSLLFAFSEACTAYGNRIGAADYESVSLWYMSKNCRVYKNIFDILKPNNFDSMTHVIQQARPTPAVPAMTAMRGDWLPRDNYIEENIFLIRHGVGSVVTSHSGDGLFVKNNFIKYFSTNLSFTWGIRPFSGCKNIDVSNNIIDLTEYTLANGGVGFITTGTSAAGNETENINIHGNIIKIKNTDLLASSGFGTQSMIGSYLSGQNKNVSIVNNTIEIDGYGNNLQPIIACNGDNINVRGNVVHLKNPLEVILASGPVLFVTKGGINIVVKHNNVTGAIGKGVEIRIVDPIQPLKNIEVDNIYSDILGEEVVHNDHPDKEEIISGNADVITQTAYDAIPVKNPKKTYFTYEG